MKKLFGVTIAILLSCVLAYAQPVKFSHEGRFYVGLQAGPMLNINENHFSYKENGRALGLITYQAGLVGGYDVNDIFGLRLSASFAKNASACNTRNTSAHGFYPYSFSSVNVFMDAILDLHGLSDLLTPLRIKLYGGMGLGHSFNMTDSHHPWQDVSDPNTAFGFRFGGIVEYNFNHHFGIFGDLCGEAYTDKYNGLMPSAEEQASDFEGYGGFPLDLRGLISFGVLYRF
ncbi:MAG: outer membrane beta-barrel protein [Bacteroidales bacterium]|nr:outer membrane beta-barrel protein [Bacteroidales bacterium]